MKGWATLKNDITTASILAELVGGSVLFIRGYVEQGKELIHIGAGGLKELEKWGFEYPDYVAEITEQLEKHEQEEPNTFI